MGLISGITDRIKTTVTAPFSIAGATIKGALNPKLMGLGALTAVGLALAVPTGGLSLGLVAAGAAGGAGLGAALGFGKETLNQTVKIALNPPTAGAPQGQPGAAWGVPMGGTYQDFQRMQF